MQFGTSTPSALHSSLRTFYFPCSNSANDLCSSLHMQFATHAVRDVDSVGPCIQVHPPLIFHIHIELMTYVVRDTCSSWRRLRRALYWSEPTPYFPHSYWVNDLCSSRHMQCVTSTPSALHSSLRTLYFPYLYWVNDLCSSWRQLRWALHWSLPTPHFQYSYLVNDVCSAWHRLRRALHWSQLTPYFPYSYLVKSS